jgi:hypothetical protein
VLSLAASAGWSIGIVLGALALIALAAILLALLYLTFQIASLANAAEHGMSLIRGQTQELEDVAHVNDSAVRILRAVRALRKVAVGE